MITFGTNIFNKISLTNKKDLEKNLNELFKVTPQIKLEEYEDKDLEDNPKAKFFFSNLPLKQILTEIKIWDLFVELLKKIMTFSKASTEENEVQFWITSKEIFPVNIVFSIKDENDSGEKLQSLRDTLLVSNIFQENNLQKDKILVVGYDNEGSAWRINYI